MSISDDMLMAYADGEFDKPEFASERNEVEMAIGSDPELARRVERFRSLRRDLGSLYAEVLEEPVPERLLNAARAQPREAATVTDLAQARTAKKASGATSSAAGTTAVARKLRPWFAIAASLIVGVLVGHYALVSQGAGPIAVNGASLLAQSSLRQALSDQLAADQSRTAAVQIGLSFRSKSGQYCRTFMLEQREPVSGLACHQGAEWRIDALALAETAGNGGAAYRPAGSSLPAAVRAAVEDQMAGEPLDAQGEMQAKREGWK
jgi:anti-sigma factor RsiW